MANPFDLSGKVALVTGASSGLGVVFATALARAGADLVIAARRARALSETAAAIVATGRRCLPVVTDVTRESEVCELLSETLREYGQVDILVNCAGTIGGFKIEETKVDEFQRILNVNLTSVFICCKQIGAHMVERGRGRIINIASVFGLVAARPQGPSLSYVTSKHAVVGFTRELAMQWAKSGVTVNAIAPGYFPSEMVSAEFLEREDVVEDITMMTGMGREGRPEELEGVVVLLASDTSSYMTGQTVCVDGGWTVR